MAERQTLFQLLIYQHVFLRVASNEGSVAYSVKAPGRLYFSEVAPGIDNRNAAESANIGDHGLVNCPISCMPIDKVTQDLTVKRRARRLSQKRLNDKISQSEGRVAEKTMARGGLQIGDFWDSEGPLIPDIDTLSNMMTIESNYTGLHLDNEKVTVKFMEDLLTAFKDPKNLKKPALHAKYVLIILREIKKHYKKQPSLIEINVPRGRNITVVGDVHAHFSEIVKVFNVSGFPWETNYFLFNGDFVDRGVDDLQNALTIFGFKLLYPNSFFINRGNHEDRNQNSHAGFDESCNRIYTPPITDAFHDVWTWLPLAHRINEKVLVVHGGLSPHKKVTLNDIRREPRGTDPQPCTDQLYFLREGDLYDDDNVYKPNDKLPPPYQNESIMYSLLWADPMDENGVGYNAQRCGGTRFGPDITENFCKRNQIEFVIRSHEPVFSPSFEGYYMKHGGRIITIFTVAGYFFPKSKAALIQMQAPDMKTHIIKWSTKDRLEAFDSFVHEKVKLG